jgi:hypothetical protein
MARDEVAALLESVRALVLPDQCYFSLERCPLLGKWVLHEVKNSPIPSTVSAFESLRLDGVQMIAVAEAGYTLNSLLDAVCEEGGDAINKAHYSCHQQKFQAMTVEDYKLIEAALSQ